MSQATILVRSGTYRNKSVANMAFELVEQYKKTANGGHVTVKNNNTFPDCPDTIRIKVDGVASYEFVTGNSDYAPTAPAAVTAELLRPSRSTTLRRHASESHCRRKSLRTSAWSR